MMEIGISWCAYGRGVMTPLQQIDLLKENGFFHTFPMSNEPDIDEIMPLLAENGIAVDSCHAPFRGINQIWNRDSSGDVWLHKLLKGAETCARYEVPVLVVHLSSGDDAPGVNDAGAERFCKLVETAKEQGVTIAFENQRKLANLAYAMEAYPDAAFCWDVGHEQCFAGGKAFMPFFGDRIITTHIHDNFKVQNGDLHMLPFDGTIDFDRVAAHFVEAGYHGTVMLEVSRGASNAYESDTPAQYYAKAARAAMRLRDKIEALYAAQNAEKTGGES